MTAHPGCRRGAPQAEPARRPDTTLASAAPSARLLPTPRPPRGSSDRSAPATARAAAAGHPLVARDDTAHTDSPRRPLRSTPPSTSVPAGPSAPRLVVLL